MKGRPDNHTFCTRGLLHFMQMGPGKIMSCGYFKTVEEEICRELSSRSGVFRVVSVQGTKLSGKKTVTICALNDLKEEFAIISLPEITNDGVAAFIEKLRPLELAYLSGIDDIELRYKSVLSDLLLSLRLRPDGISRRWVFTSASTLPFADVIVKLPSLHSDSATHEAICNSMLDGFELDGSCEIRSVLVQSSRELSVGDLAALVRYAKTLAISESTPLSCKHLLRAFNSLSLGASPVSLPSSSQHMCSFSARLPGSLSLDDFIGLSQEQKDLINKFQTDSSTMLHISGPIGCGKSHLASSIVWNLTKPAARVTSADILHAKIGETEKALHKALMEKERLIIEDLDKICPEDSSESTGSIQRCLPVIVSFLDRLKRDPTLKNRQIVATSREPINPLLAKNIMHLELKNSLSFEHKIALIKSAYPSFNAASVTPFDLINMTNRSGCVEYGRSLKMTTLRALIQPS